MPGWIGPGELLLLAVVALIFFGPKRLPEAGRSLGKGLREFKNAITNHQNELMAETTSHGESEAPPELEAVPRKPRDTIG